MSMFSEQFGLAEMPFRLTPDDRYFYASEEHARALSHLLFGLAQHEGFVVITGEVGAGKTTVVERLMAELSPTSYRVVTVATPSVGATGLLSLIAADFGVQRGADKADLILGLRDVWRADRGRGRRALVIVDEAQGLSFDALEELRMLSNLTERGNALVQTVLLGQPEFRRILASGELDQLRQRVLASYHLGPLRAEDVGTYIRHRLTRAGAARSDLFDPAAIAAVARLTGGVPRLINRLCGRALLNAALEGEDRVTAPAIEAIAAELEADLVNGSQPAAPAAVLPGGEAERGDYEQLFREGQNVIGRLIRRARPADEG